MPRRQPLQVPEPNPESRGVLTVLLLLSWGFVSKTAHAGAPLRRIAPKRLLNP